MTQSILINRLFLVTAMFAAMPAVASAGEGTRVDVYFQDDFESWSPDQGAPDGSPGSADRIQWQSIGAPDKNGGVVEVSERQHAEGSGTKALRFARSKSNSSPTALSARLRLPYRSAAYASMDLFFDGQRSDSPNALTLSLAQPNSSRIARLRLEQPVDSDQVRIILEDGTEADQNHQVATMPARQWCRLTWGNDAANNTVTLVVQGKTVLDATTVVPQKRSFERQFDSGSVSQLIFYPAQASEVYVDNLVVHAENPHLPEPAPPIVNYETEKKQAIMCVDFADQGYFDALQNHHIYTVDQIRALLTDCKAAGIDTVLWRVSCIGSVTYPSKIENWHAFSKDALVPHHSLADIMDRYDPLWEACKIGHELGIKVFAWVTLYDEGLVKTPHLSKQLREHPEYQWVDRSGRNYFEGVPSYAFKETREFRTALIKEVCSYPVDGLFLSLRSHSVSNPSYSNKDIVEFGYEQPVVDAYQEQYGVDIRTEDFDRKKWHTIKGEFFTQLLRDIRAEIPPPMPVWLCPVSAYGDGPSSKSQHALDYDTWKKEKLVQGIAVCGPPVQKGKAHEPGLEPLMPIRQSIIDRYGFLRDLGMDLFYFAAVDQKPRCRWDYIPTLLDVLKGTPFQGMTIMEAFRFDLGDPRWPVESTVSN